MEHENLLVVGAGFSRNAGLPLASAFTSALLNTTRLNLTGPSNALVRFVEDFVNATFAEGQSALAEDWPELEDVFTLVDLSANTGHHLGNYSASELRLVRRAMLVRMILMLSQHYTRAQRSPNADWRQLERFFREFDESQTAVLSMNWDTVIEAGLARTQGLDRIDYGCDATGVDFQTNGQLRTRRPNSRTRVMLTKPHGSVNWLYCDACRDVFWMPPSSVSKAAQILFREQDWRAVANRTRLRQSNPVRGPACPHCGNHALGTRFATFSYRKALDFPMHAASWRTAERHMRDATHWIFFGYSMPSADFEFKYLLKRVQLALRDKPRITVITGGTAAAATETVRRFDKFFGNVPGERFYFADGLTDEVLDHLRDIGVMNP
ncbi:MULTISPECIES: hypothetical protein [unclassified Mesorhizobium]|uniref:hypothetical protein n=1 Tax=unclassified Mesorhizobium TaxID=325217 RepID=UPI000FCC83B8|nr:MULTISPECIES: hypothetical protein [unclassified Mesorhizobium]RUX97537.1 hypothetical protein EN993_03255 [Mesorhizobium sp. M7D.F.Ca.US.004.01.2.1]RVA33443.1 hypothetical protein EN935_09290 [Mesorhizobium sp. M7D.F.Ca.US.004.03.1.1]